MLRISGEELLGRPWVGGRLQDDERAGAKVTREEPGRVLDVGEVRVAALLEGGRDGDEGHVKACELVSVDRRQVTTRRQCGRKRLVAHILDVGVASGQPGDPVIVHVDADDR